MSISRPLRCSGSALIALLLSGWGGGGCSLSPREGAVRVQEYAVLAAAEDGFPLSFGSGVACRNTPSENVSCVGITDRGPTTGGPDISFSGLPTRTSVVFEHPHFSPHLVEFHLTPKDAVVTRVTTLRRSEGVALSGRPRPEGVVGSTREVPLSLTLDLISTDTHGIDPEAISFDKYGALRGCDEYGPFIFSIDAEHGLVSIDGEPGAPLPQSWTARTPNRGCEALAMTASGAMFLGLQSPIKGEPFVRFAMIDEGSSSAAEYHLPLDGCVDLKIGDLASINDSKFLALETRTYRAGEPPEVSLITLAIPPEGSTLQRAQIFSLSKEGWSHGKAEGLAILPSRDEVLISNDSDFGREYHSIVDFEVLAVRREEGSNERPSGNLSGGESIWVRRGAQKQELRGSQVPDALLFRKSMLEPISVRRGDASTVFWRVKLWTSVDKL